MPPLDDAPAARSRSTTGGADRRGTNDSASASASASAAPSPGGHAPRTAGRGAATRGSALDVAGESEEALRLRTALVRARAEELERGMLDLHRAIDRHLDRYRDGSGHLFVDGGAGMRARRMRAALSAARGLVDVLDRVADEGQA